MIIPSSHRALFSLESQTKCRSGIAWISSPVSQMKHCITSCSGCSKMDRPVSLLSGWFKALVEESELPNGNRCPNRVYVSDRVCRALQISDSRYRRGCHIKIQTRLSYWRPIDTFFNPRAMIRPVMPAKAYCHKGLTLESYLPAPTINT
jgi:hypothetical protein